MIVAITERPVLRDPKSGLLDRHPAYSGWVPKDRPLFSGHVRGIVWGGIAAGAVVLIQAVLS